MKLYWRYKKDGKWTWQAVVFLDNEKLLLQELFAEARILEPEFVHGGEEE